MNDIEEGARPLISAMIRGQRIDLDLTQQLAIGKWLCLKALIERYSRTPIDPVPEEWRRQFYQHHEPPASWHAWITRYDGDLPVLIAPADLSTLIRNPLSPIPFPAHGFVMTMVIGYFAAQVFGFNEKVTVKADPSRRLHVWPHPLLRLMNPPPSPDELMTWPPPRWINDDLLIKMSQTLPESR
jgi:hypothetical protein